MAPSSSLHRFASPARFMRMTSGVLPWLTAVTVMLLAVGTYMALFVAPPDYQQGNTVRIMFVHVPAATIAEIAYGCLALASASALVWRHPLAEVAARAVAPLGAGFTLVCLVTGSLWGAPMWGTWWVWDARLTSVLVLFFLYLGYIALANAFDDPRRGGRAAAVLALVGAVNIPIIKFSVNWWNTLHQPASLLRMGGSTIDPSILRPLLVMMAAFGLMFATLWILRIRTALIDLKIQAIQMIATENLAAAGFMAPPHRANPQAANLAAGR